MQFRGEHYMIMRLREGDEFWEYIGKADSWSESSLMALQDAVNNGSNFHEMGSQWAGHDDDPNHFWRGVWTRVTGDGNITYQIFRVR